MADALQIVSLRFLPMSAGGTVVPLRTNLQDSGPGLSCEIGGNIPLLLPGKDLMKSGLLVSVETIGEGEFRAVWEGGTSDAVAVSENVQMALPVDSLFTDGLSVKDLEIDWQTKGENGDWQSLGKTTHRCYLSLGQPNEPWDPMSTDPADRNLVWTDVLDIAFDWAKACKDIDTACEAITSNLYESGRFSYDTENGASNYTTASDYFECEEFVERIQGGDGYGEKLNCTDCATIVSTLANALGANLYQVQLMYMFKVNPIQAIGTDYWNPPFNGGFSYHEIAWNGELDEKGLIYDACLKVNESSPTLPVRMPYDGQESSMSKLYRSHLAVPGETGYDICAPEKRSVNIRKID